MNTTPEMNHPSGRLSRFLAPTGISESLTLALGVVVFLVLLVGGTSLALAFRIHKANDGIAREYSHILVLDQVHSILDDLMFELQQMDATGSFDRTDDVDAMHQDLTQHLDLFERFHEEENETPQANREEVLLGSLRRVGEDLFALTHRAAERPGAGRRLERADLDRLNRTSHEVPRAVGELVSLHRLRIAGLLQESQGVIRESVALYVVFIVVSGLLVVVAGIVSRQKLSVPLGRLADTALAIAEGRLDARVRVQSRNEIGRLSHAFNIMADNLQVRERELQAARDQLEQRVREIQTLHRIGTEISRLQQPDRILQSVVEKARELLQCDAAALCLYGSGSDQLVARATSGPPEAFCPEAEPRCGPHGPSCPAMEPEYMCGHLSAVLRLGDMRLGEIHVSTHEVRQFTAWEAELLDGLATQAAIAIERVRLTEEHRSLATVQERERLAREMHDGFAQALGLLHMKLQGAQSRVTDPSAVTDALHEMTDITRQAYEEVRQSIFGLRTFVARGLGLVPTLTEYLHEFSARNGIAVELEVADGPALQLPPASEVQAIRIIQEALSNIRKHASASRAWIRLRRDQSRIVVTIEDDGVGWESAHSASQDKLHFGLHTMRERAESLRGTLEIDTAPGRGTRVVASIPGEAP